MDQSGGQSDTDLPRTAKAVMQILSSMGVTEYEPKVVPQLLEFCYKYIHDTLDDASRYAVHRGAKPQGNDTSNITKEDLKLAVQTRVDFVTSAPPPREFLMDVARQKNSYPLPPATNKEGVLLPPERHCLTHPNFTVQPNLKRPPVKQGPWDLPEPSSVKAAVEAQRNRKRRKLKEGSSTATSAPTTIDSQVVQPSVADNEDDYD